MISDQENLLNTQQQQERQQQHKKHHPDKENQSPPREEEGKTVSGDSSQADTTLVADLEIVEEDVIRPQPSLPFDVLDGMCVHVARRSELYVLSACVEIRHGMAHSTHILQHNRRFSVII